MDAGSQVMKNGNLFLPQLENIENLKAEVTGK